MPAESDGEGNLENLDKWRKMLENIGLFDRPILIGVGI